MENTMSDQVGTIQEAETSPQETETPSQEGSQPQNPTPAQVENGTQGTSQVDTRQASDYETARHLKKMAKQMQSLQTALERLQSQPQPSSTNQVVNQKTWSDQEKRENPLGYIESLIDSRVKGVQEEIPKNLTQIMEKQRFQTEWQDATKLIETNPIVKADPQGIERIKDILEDEQYGLNDLSNSRPLQAARMALELYNLRHGKAKVSSPAKNHMVSTATQATSGNGGSTSDAEAESLLSQAAALGNMNDPEFQSKLKSLTDKIKLEQRLQGVKK